MRIKLSELRRIIKEEVEAVKEAEMPLRGELSDYDVYVKPMENLNQAINTVSNNHGLDARRFSSIINSFLGAIKAAKLQPVATRVISNNKRTVGVPPLPRDSSAFESLLNRMFGPEHTGLDPRDLDIIANDLEDLLAGGTKKLMRGEQVLNIIMTVDDNLKEQVLNSLGANPTNL